MAWTFSTNNTPTNGSFALYILITQLVSAGWTKVADSDGTTYSASGTQVTSGNTGTNGLGNTNAWVRLQAPLDGGLQREFTIQRGTNNTSWRIKYSAGNGFTGGTPGATQTPSATDEVLLVGTGTDASPTHGSVFTTDGSYRYHIVTGGATEGYAWAAWCMNTSTTNASSLMFMDKMLANSGPASDTDPVVIGLIVTSAIITSLTNNDSSNCKSWFGDRATSSNNRTLGIWTYGSTALGSGNTLGVNAFTGKDDLVPIPWMRGSLTPKSWKGFSTLLKWSSMARTSMDTYNVVTTRDYIYVAGAVFPWDGSIPTI